MLRRPKLVMLGAALQYTVMPGLGFLISRVFQLPPAYAVGCGAASRDMIPMIDDPCVQSSLIWAHSSQPLLLTPVCGICNLPAVRYGRQKVPHLAEPFAKCAWDLRQFQHTYNARGSLDDFDGFASVCFAGSASSHVAPAAQPATSSLTWCRHPHSCAIGYDPQIATASHSHPGI